MRATFALLVVTSGLLAVIYSFSVEETFPSLHRCSRHQRNIEECIARSVETMRPYLENGIPALYIPPFKAYRANERYELMLRNVFNGAVHLKNISVYGLSDFTISNVTVDENFTDIKFEAHFPYIHLIATCFLDGTLDNTSITRYKNTINQMFRRVTAITALRGKYHTNNDTKVKHFYVNDVFVQLNAGNFTVTLTHENVSTLTTAQTSFLEKNKMTLLNEILPKLKEALSTLIRTAANHIYWAFPAKQLYSTLEN